MKIKTNVTTNVRDEKGYNSKRGFFEEISKNKYLYLLTLPAIIFFFVFHYIPMGGIVIAFQRFNALKGIFGSDFVGLENFQFLANSPHIRSVIFNTLFLNILFIVTGTLISILIALFLNEIGRPIFKKLSQSIVILPHFISWTVLAMIVNGLLQTNGVINNLLVSVGLERIKFWANPDVWPAILTIMNLWKTAGFGSIIYLAAITGMSSQIFEAARIDGANRLQTILYIILPSLKNTAILLFILAVGRIFYGNFGLIYPIIGDNSLLMPTTDIIDTYVYRALMQIGDISISAAVGLAQSFTGFVLVLVTNTIVKKFNPESAIF